MKIITDRETAEAKGQAVVVVIHYMPRFSVCALSELGTEWKKYKPSSRITTFTFQAGGMDYVTEFEGEGVGIEQWSRGEPWCGQTAFTFPFDESMFDSKVNPVESRPQPSEPPLQPPETLIMLSSSMMDPRKGP